MKHDNRVAWTEGMFLRVQHFQQADRWAERLVRSSNRDLHAHGWGLSTLEIDRDALSIGRFALSAVRGIMPDGTIFEAPGDADLPPAADLPAGIKDAIVYLALPARRPGRADTASEEANGTGVRLVVSPYEAPDANTGSDLSASIEVGRLRLRHLVTGDELGGQELVPLARVVEVRSDQAVVLDEGFIPPSLNCDAGGRLLSLLTELLGIVRHRAEAVAQRIGDPTVRGTAEVGDFLLLQTLNRSEPLLAHLASQARQIHPEDFYRTCLQLAGELATFTAQNKRATSFPPYRHDDLQATFAAVFDDLRS